jgi:hypothetical protein
LRLKIKHILLNINISFNVMQFHKIVHILIWDLITIPPSSSWHDKNYVHDLISRLSTWGKKQHLVVVTMNGVFAKKM